MFTKTYIRGTSRRVGVGLVLSLSAAALGVVAAGPAQAAPADRSAVSATSALVYQKTNYADDLFQVDTVTKTAKRLSLAEWARLGYPQPTVVPAITGTKYVKIAASDRLFAVVGNTSTELTFAAWRGAGYPTPSVVAAEYVKYTGWNSIYAVSFVTTDKNEWVWVQLTFDEWVRAGQPAPKPCDWIIGSRYLHNINPVSAEQYPMVLLFEGKYMPLARWAWEAAGSPVPEATYGGNTTVAPW
ncbi:hypothetical protein JT358_04565 [Micrococcales bacterium 31B]|nr:hypothetical protein [Micrococcales bacterium 31B]